MADPGDDDVVRPLVSRFAMLARKDRDRSSAGGFRAAVSRGHDLVEATRHDRAAPLREQPPDFFRGLLPL